MKRVGDTHMPELTCAVVEDLMDAYLAGETSDDTRRVLQEHIGECTACQAVLALRRRAREAVVGGSDRAAGSGNGNGKRATARRVVVRARRRLYFGIAFILAVAVSLVGVGLDQVYAYRTPAPVAVEGAEAYAAGAVSGWGMARALGAVQDVGEKVTDWLTIDSVLFGHDATYVLYTTSNRTKVAFVAGHSQPPAFGAPSVDAGAVSGEGFHGIAALPPLPMGWEQVEGANEPVTVQVPLAAPEVKLAVTDAWRLRNLLGVWTATPLAFERPLTVNLEFDPAAIMVQGQVYRPGTIIELLGGTITVDEVVLGYPTASLALTLDMPDDVRLDGLSLRVLAGEGQATQEWMSRGTVVSLREGRRQLTLFGPAFAAVPESLVLCIDKVHLEESGTTDIAIPWAEYVERAETGRSGSGDGTELTAWPSADTHRETIIRFDQAERYQLGTVHGTLQVVGLNPNPGKLVMEFHSADGQPVPGDVWPLAPYTFPAQLIGSGGERWTGGGSTQMWEDGGIHYYAMEIPRQFAEDNPTFTLRFEKRGLEVEVGKSWLVELGN